MELFGAQTKIYLLMDNICKICNQEIDGRAHFYKNHKIKEKDYYEKYLPKQDLLTGEKIEFKNPEQYELQDFNRKNNLKKFIENQPLLSSNTYLTQWLKKRKQLKNISYAPSQFEIKSLQFPSIKYINQKYGNNIAYQTMCQAAGLKCLYDYNNILYFKDYLKQIFLCDTREQTPLSLPDMEIQKLDVGDYTLEGSNIYIERKSLNDLIGTLSKGYERFKKELDRCVKNNCYLIVLIEEKYSNLLSFNYLPQCKKVQTTPDFILHRARELLNLYPNNLQMLAVDGRKECARIIEKIFRLDNNVSNIDLQFYYDKEDL